MAGIDPLRSSSSVSALSARNLNERSCEKDRSFTPPESFQHHTTFADMRSAAHSGCQLCALLSESYLNAQDPHGREPTGLFLQRVLDNDIPNPVPSPSEDHAANCCLLPQPFELVLSWEQAVRERHDEFFFTVFAFALYRQQQCCYAKGSKGFACGEGSPGFAVGTNSSKQQPLGF